MTGVFDIGPPPPPAEEPRETLAKPREPVESFREKALRRAKEEEARGEAGSVALDHWPASGCAPVVADAKRAQQLPANSAERWRISTGAALKALRTVYVGGNGESCAPRNDGPSRARVYMEYPDMANEQVLIVQFGQIGGASARFTPRMTAREIANELHRLAHRIETGLCRR